MRSSKNRSRSKGNRNRSVGNIVNRVFDSSGPESKVRGTPQQIIDKYTQLMRDAQLSGDRVAAENFAQHAEHYTRMLAEAQREQDARREQHEQQQPKPQNRDDRGEGGRGDGGRDDDAPRSNDNRADEARSAEEGGGLAEPIDTGSTDEAGLVETPEDKPRNRRRRKPKAQDGDQQDADTSGEPQQAAE